MAPRCLVDLQRSEMAVEDSMPISPNVIIIGHRDALRASVGSIMALRSSAAERGDAGSSITGAHRTEQ